ncbi:hypothetical protein DFH09DRAFT_503649 [Mycena vulgaris]|nr:hypothetical protein DFH09DRAFT_503649 [Mycena vulgaris]
MESFPQLLHLPNELLINILDLLCETSLSLIRCGEETKLPSYSTRHISSLSLVNRRLHQLCLPLLFYSLKFRHAQALQLRAFEAKCAEDTRFASLIRRLDLSYLNSSDILSSLPVLLSRLTSLQWLDLDVDQIDVNLLATVNSHSNLHTVAVCDSHLHSLRTLASSTSISFSKILINSATLEYCGLAQEMAALRSLMTRSPRLPHLILHDENIIKDGAGTLLLPGLEKLDIRVYSKRISPPMSWLPAFVERHKTLQTVTFTGDKYGRSWSRDPDILFPMQFMSAVDRDDLRRTVILNSFSISCTGSPFLDSWQVTEVEMTITKAVGVSALRIISSLAPQLSTLVIRMPRAGRSSIPVDDLVSALGCFSSLRRLDLQFVYKHLLFGGQAPWALAPSDTGRKISDCITAHAALRWITARVAQGASAIDFFHLTDQGDDCDGHLRHVWKLKATYEVRRDGQVELTGTPQLIMAARYRPRASS